MKKCSKCAKFKTVDNFRKDSRSKDELQSWCIECTTTAQKDAALRANYGITLNDYNALVIAQGGECKICRRNDRSLWVDHCHDTGKVRGLLCPGCNTGLGSFGDKIEGLEAAINYLKEIQ